MKILSLAAALAVAGMMVPMPSQAAGCASGGIVGGIVGHMAGHGVAGAAAGCAIGHQRSNNRAREEQLQREYDAQQRGQPIYRQQPMGRMGQRQTTFDPNPAHSTANDSGNR